MELLLADEQETHDLGLRLGKALRGGSVIELVGDVGAGKTTLTRALARGMGITAAIQSPTFTINNLYDTPNRLRLSHYDFYRLTDAGVMADELTETIDDKDTVTVVEWGDIIADVLPKDRLTITFVSTSETARRLSFTAGGPESQHLLEKLS